MEEFLEAIESVQKHGMCVSKQQGSESSNASQTEGDGDLSDEDTETIFVQLERVDGAPEFIVKEELCSSPLKENLENLTSSARPSSKRPAEDSTGLSTDMKRQKTLPTSACVDAILSTVKEGLANSQKEDEFDIVGKMVAAKLKRMPAKMRLRAEKLIDQTLTRGLMSTLNLSTKLVSS